MYKKWVDDITSLLYPKRCPVCGELLKENQRRVCKECNDIFQLIKEPRCKKCSKPIEMEEAEYCYDCYKKQHHYNTGYALWIYDKNTKQSISDFKYGGRREYSDYYVEEVLKYYGTKIKSLYLDALLPIPLHKTKYRFRGFNQAELLATGIGEKLRIPVVTNIILRNRKTMPQKELNDKERLKNLAEAFYVDNQIWEKSDKIQRVMLIDDIYTTGSTIEACTQVLLSQGIKQIYFFALCIGRGF